MSALKEASQLYIVLSKDKLYIYRMLACQGINILTGKMGG